VSGRASHAAGELRHRGGRRRHVIELHADFSRQGKKNYAAAEAQRPRIPFCLAPLADLLYAFQLGEAGEPKAFAIGFETFSRLRAYIVVDAA
jgi:hypothetical protein